ncbi:11403_t:CDS:2, partial [Dentiscutata heterogama]
DSYFEVLLAAARNNNTWKIVGRPTYNYAADIAVQLMETNLVDEAIDTIVINEYGDTIIVDNTVDSVMESAEINMNNNKACMKQAIEKLDNMLEKNSKQVDKGTKVHLQVALQYLCLRYQDWTKINLSAMIAVLLGWGAYKTRCICIWGNEWLRWQKLPKENHGKHVKIASLIDDEIISIKIISYLQYNKFSVNLKILKEFVENEVFLSLEWKKNVYVDEYEQKDVVQYQQEVFLPIMAELEPLLIEYDKNDLTKLGPEGEQKLCPKGRDRCIHVSEFLCELLEHVYLTVEQHLAHPEIPNRYVTETFE